MNRFTRTSLLALLMLTCALPLMAEDAAPVHMATGFKICEVDTDSVIIWTRLTRHAERVPADRPMAVITYRVPDTGETVEERQAKARNAVPEVSYPDGYNVETIAGAVPGAPGVVRIRHRAVNGDWHETHWEPVDPSRDFTRQTTLAGLTPDTEYELEVQGASGPADVPYVSLTGRFRTAPAPDTPARVSFLVTTGHSHIDMDDPAIGYRIYGPMLDLHPSFFVHTGDILYYDTFAKNIDLARWGWQFQYSFPGTVRFHRIIPSYFIKDDHDTWMNDCWPTMETNYMGEFTFAQGQAVFLEQVGMGARQWRSVRWGKDLQIWLVEGRDDRSPNDMPDGPDKTIWGPEQKRWFKETVAASDATFRVLVSPTPLVGPDRPTKGDNHANNEFRHEGEELRAFIGAQKNMFVACGDRHWQYVSVDPATGVREYSCGPSTDKHAGGFSEDDRSPMHRYLKIAGGFLEVVVERPEGKPTIAFRHRDVAGHVVNEDVIVAE